jgi:hypothetical protein
VHGCDIAEIIGPIPRRLRPVFSTLASFADADGTSAYPRISTLADLTGRNPGNVRRQLGELGELGAISPCGSRSGGRRPTVWRIEIEALRAVDNVPILSIVDEATRALGARPNPRARRAPTT